MFTIDTEFKGLSFKARCVVSISGSAELQDKGIATVTFFNDPYGALMSLNYQCDLSKNQGVDDIEEVILSMDEYKGAEKIN